MIRENHINREREIGRSKFSYTDFMKNINLLAVVTPPSIYHFCYTQKTFWKKRFTPMNIKIVVIAMIGNTEG